MMRSWLQDKGSVGHPRLAVALCVTHPFRASFFEKSKKIAFSRKFIDGRAVSRGATSARKNATISTTNVERAAKWEDHKRQQNDKIAAMLQESLDATASLRLTSLEKKHAFPAPHENMLNGGAMWRDLKDLKGTLNAEESEETSLAAWRHLAENPLPDNATSQQFAERLTEFDKHISDLPPTVPGRATVHSTLHCS